MKTVSESVIQSNGVFVCVIESLVGGLHYHTTSHISPLRPLANWYVDCESQLTKAHVLIIRKMH